MASDFPGKPWLLKGALVVFELTVPVPTNIIVFQYNPETISRSLRQEFERLSFLTERKRNLLPPRESFTFNVDLDAADQLETGNVLARSVGLHPTLAALELLLYPAAEDRLLARLAAVAGAQVIEEKKPPLVLLVWGAPRIVPVAVTSLTVTEEAFDQLLNPIRARVSLGIEALPDKDLVGTPLEGFGYLRHRSKEVLARTAIAASVGEIRGMLPV